MPNNLAKTEEQEKKWEKAKEIVKNEYDVKEGSDDYYRLVVGIYKKMTKSANGDEIVQNLYEEGVISKVAFDYYKSEKQYMNIVNKVFGTEKIANKINQNINIKLAEEPKNSHGFLKSFGKNFLLTLGASAALSGGAALTVGGLNKIKTLIARSQRKKNLEKIMKFNPSLKEVDPEVLNEGMRILEDANPSYTKNPILAGTFLKSIHNFNALTPEQYNAINAKEQNVFPSTLSSNLRDLSLSLIEKAKKKASSLENKKDQKIISAINLLKS